MTYDNQRPQRIVAEGAVTYVHNGRGDVRQSS